MKKQFIILFILIGFCSRAQNRQFKDLEDFSNWMSNYYLNPEPNLLFDAFMFGCSNQEIANSGSRSYLTVFFASCMRSDTTQQSFFFSKLKETTTEDFIYSFVSILWLINTEYSSNLLTKFLSQNQVVQYQKEFEAIAKAKHPDIWADPIVNVMQIDVLWVDFFATGNERSVEKIISVLDSLNSKNDNIKVIASSAKWSLISNAIKHDKVLLICQSQKKVSNKELAIELDEVINTASIERAK